MTTRVRRDPITFELVKNALASIADEMAVTIGTSFSPMACTGAKTGRRPTMC
jgi:hypothetical protein